MIKKIPDILDGGLCNSGCAKKINELVDTINELQAKEDEIKEWIGIVSDLREQVKQLKTDKTVGLIYVEPEPKAIRDPYAEQRKWIGKLCTFWDDDVSVWKVGTLVDIRPEADDGKRFTYRPADSTECFYFTQGFKYCRPIAADEELIYKGGQDGH